MIWPNLIFVVGLFLSLLGELFSTLSHREIFSCKLEQWNTNAISKDIGLNHEVHETEFRPEPDWYKLGAWWPYTEL